MIRMMEPAAPYPAPGLALPKYKPKAVLPKTNKKAVTNPPNHTKCHLSLTSGKILNIITKSTVIINSENTKLITWKKIRKEEET